MLLYTSLGILIQMEHFWVLNAIFLVLESMQYDVQSLLIVAAVLRKNYRANARFNFNLRPCKFKVLNSILPVSLSAFDRTNRFHATSHDVKLRTLTRPAAAAALVF